MNRWILLYKYTGNSETFGHMLSPVSCFFEWHSISLFQIFVWFLNSSPKGTTSHKMKTNDFSPPKSAYIKQAAPCGDEGVGACTGHGRDI